MSCGSMRTPRPAGHRRRSLPKKRFRPRRDDRIAGEIRLRDGAEIERVVARQREARLDRGDGRDRLVIFDPERRIVARGVIVGDILVLKPQFGGFGGPCLCGIGHASSAFFIAGAKPVSGGFGGMAGGAACALTGGMVGDAGVVVAGCNAFTTGAAGIGGRADVSGEAGGLSCGKACAAGLCGGWKDASAGAGLWFGSRPSHRPLPGKSATRPAPAPEPPKAGKPPAQ